MKKYQLIGEDEKVFKIKHPDGSEFHIAKHAVGPQVHKRIKALKMYDGGRTPSSEELDIQPAEIQDQPQAPLDIQPDIDETGSNVRPTERVPATIPDTSTNSISAVPTAPSMGMNPALQASFGEKRKAIEDTSTVQNEAFKNTTNALKNLAKEENRINLEAQAKAAPLEAKGQQLFQDIANSKREYHGLFSNMNTGNKILAALSIAFSGIGSGLTGKPNMAMDVLQKGVEQDIENQKMELGKKETLFSENLRLLGDQRAATAATKAQMLAATQAQVQAYGAQSSNAQSTLNKQLLLTNLKVEEAKANQEATYRTMGMQGGNFDPSMLVSKLVPKERQAEVFKEIKDAQNIRKGSKEGMNAFEQASKEQRVVSKNVIPGVNSPYVGELQASVLPQFQNIDGTVRQAAMDAFLPKITPAIGDSQHTIDVKRETLANWYQAHSAAPTALGYGINLDKFGSTTSEPISKTKTVNGITYRRGPNGEAIKVE